MKKKESTRIKDLHLECDKCKHFDEFYEKFNTDSEKNESYFGVISYKYASDKSKEEPTKNKTANISFLQLKNEWTVKERIAKRMKQEGYLELKNKLYSRRYREIKMKRKSGPKPSFYLPEHTGNLISIKKSESFTESFPEDTVCSDNLETAKVVDE